MAYQDVQVEAINFDEIRQALDEAPESTFVILRDEFNRSARRFRKPFRAQYMSGSPARDRKAAKAPSEMLHGGQFNKGNHVKGFALPGQGTAVGAAGLESLRAIIKLSKFLRPHATGAKIPESPGVLYLSRKTGRAGLGHIFARVKQVILPARLPFERESKRHLQNDLIPRIPGAVARSLRVAMARRLKVIESAGRAFMRWTAA